MMYLYIYIVLVINGLMYSVTEHIFTHKFLYERENEPTITDKVVACLICGLWVGSLPLMLLIILVSRKDS